MNIEDISEHFESSPIAASDILNLSCNRGQKPGELAQMDRANTSRFSKLMAQGVQGLRQELAPRQEKIEQFRDFVDDPSPLSNKAIDAMFASMIS